MRAELSPSRIADWAEWNPSAPYSIGIEEEVMMLDPHDWSLAQKIDDVLPLLSPELASRATAETHGAALELASHPHDDVEHAAREMGRLRGDLARELGATDLRVASAGTHPFAVWNDTEISSGARYQLVYEAMRELARREPTFALHVHVGVSDPDAAIVLYNRLRAHLPLLLALSVNSPFWQGRDTGLASARTPLFQAFPRVGIPRAFASYEDYVEAVDLLLRCEAFPDPTFLWWDVRPQPRFGTVEVRIMDAQITASETAALAALVQSVARLELEEGYYADPQAPEVLDENRFLAARDGMGARLIDQAAERRVPARELLARLLEAARPHAADLGCENLLEMLVMLGEEPGAKRQRRVAKEVGGLPGLVELLSQAFVS
jgi:carboxylate-amine ligase